MKKVFGNDTSFLASIPVLSTRVFVKDKELRCSLVTQDNVPFSTCSLDIGWVAIDFLYEPMFEQVVGFLEVSAEIVSRIKNGEESQWSYFSNFANNLFDNGKMHPFYFPVFVHIVNAFRSGMRDTAGEFLADDFFVQQGIVLRELKQRVSEVLDTQDAVEENGQVVECYRQIAFQSPVELTNLYAEFEEEDLVMVLRPQSPLEMWNYLLPCYVTAAMRFKRCENCKRFFATTGRGNPKFCERIIKGMGKTCRQVMPKLNFNSKADKDPAVYLYNRAYKTMYSRIAAGTITKKMFHEWEKRARERRDACSRREITPEEYSTWLCDNGLFRDYLKEKK